ncbi:C13 family peptidase [Maricurvus nonylphenolicus]|uniref:C13 family peptidase n=1 Tax=Maricurvus nonylphenolicus TaxID=1008307 RepID=UPI0036F4491A
MKQSGRLAISLALGISLGAVSVTLFNQSYHIEAGEIRYHPALRFADGATYSGPVNEDGVAAGEGHMQWPNGDEYQGEFANGLFHGKGEFISHTGYRYTGDYQQGSGNGKGSITYSDGIQYSGQIKNNQPHGQGLIIFSEGNLYEGQFERSKIQGQGKWTVTDDYTYTGGFHDDRFHGQGDIVYANGNRYTGEFIEGEFHGQGTYIENSGERYSGTFQQGNFSGQGSYSNSEGRAYVGEFKDWVANGKGVDVDEDGNQYQGQFENGVLVGQGVFIGSNSSRYEGEFNYGRFDGQGKLIASNGDIYEGEFRYGSKHGKGIYTANHDDAKPIHGEWKNNELISSDSGTAIFGREEITEFALYNQLPLLEQRLNTIQPGNREQIELFTLALGSFGSEEVFRSEINFIETYFNQTLSNPEQSVYLSNSRRSLDDRPLATLTSLEKSLSTLGQKMNREQDILFLYITSHGSQNKTISFQQPGLSLQDLSSQKLRELLDQSQIKWKVVVLSACYSGGFIEDLKDDHTMVITAAASDKTSFGCDDNNKFTYFGEAFFKEALPNTNSFSDAFLQASALIQQWETEEGKENSNPQMYSSDKIIEHLERWRDQRSARTETSTEQTLSQRH